MFISLSAFEGLLGPSRMVDPSQCWDYHNILKKYDELLRREMQKKFKIKKR